MLEKQLNCIMKQKNTLPTANTVIDADRTTITDHTKQNVVQLNGKFTHEAIVHFTNSDTDECKSVNKKDMHG